jgi:hypothetical protein
VQAAHNLSIKSIKMRQKRIKIPDMPRQKKRLKWWFKNNYIFLIIIGCGCLVAALILISEVYQFEKTRNMEVLLQKSRRDMHWQGISNQDVEVLKKRYPDINWENQYDRERWHRAGNVEKERQARRRAYESTLRNK